MKIRRGPVAADNFTILPNAQVRDEGLSWEARGLLAWLHSHADGFEVTEDAIIEAGPAGRRAVRSMIHELEAASYLRRDRTPVMTGGSAVDYVLTDPRECRNSTLGKVPQEHPRADQAKGSQTDDESAGQAASAPRVPQQHPRSLLEEQEKTNEKTSSFRSATLSAEVLTGEIIVADAALFPAPVGAALEVADSPNAGQLTRRWIDYCTEKGVKLTTSVIKRYGASVRQALADGFDDALIRRALATMLADRVASRPALLDSYLIRVQQGPEMPPARLTAHQADAERRAAEAGTTATARLYDTLTRDA